MLRFLLVSIFIFSVAQADVIKVVGNLSGETSIKVDSKSLSIPGVKSVLNMLKMSGGFKLKTSGDTEFSMQFTEQGDLLQVITRLVDGQLDKDRSFAYRNMSFQNPANRVFIADEIIRRLKGDSLRMWNSRIAFSLQTGRNQREIYSCYPDGSGLQRVTKHGRIAVEPVWKGGSNFLSYIVYTSAGSKIIQYDLAKNRQRVYSSFQGLNAGLSYSSNGQYAALTLSKDGMVDLYYLMSDDAKRGGRLTQNATVEASPTWSPSGAQICYVSSDVSRAGKISTPRLNLMSLRTKQSRKLFQDGRERVSPDWSSRGQLVYSKKQGPQYVIAVCDPNNPSSTETILTRSAGHWEAPSWAPNGRHIICTRKLGNKLTLNIIDSKTKKSFAIPLNLPGVSLPDWSALK